MVNLKKMLQKYLNKILKLRHCRLTLRVLAKKIQITLLWTLANV